MVHVNFDPDTVDWKNFFENQHGAGYYFEGMPFQRGFGIGSVFANLFRYLLPLGKTIGKEFASEGLATGGRIFKDVKNGAKLKDALRKESQQGLKNFVDNAFAKAQSGNGRRKPIKGRKKSIKGKSIIGKIAKTIPPKRIDYLGPY